MNIEEISDYIINKYPDCCLAYNIKNINYDDNQLIKECEDFFYYEKLDWCECGDPDLAKETIRDYMRIIYDFHNLVDNHNMAYERKIRNFNDRFGFNSIYDNCFALCFAYAIDAAGLTEHGSSIGGAWLTNEGKMFLWLLNQNKILNQNP